MGMGSHHHHDHSHDHSHSHPLPKDRLKLAILITALILIAEFAGAMISNSLALLADSGHMLTDLAALIFSWIGFHLGEKKANNRKTFGYKRSEIVVGFTNGVLLLVLAIYIAVEATTRLFNPEPVQAEIMLGVAIIGLLANIVSAALLFKHSKENLNIKGAFLHVVGDALGSVGAIVAGLLIIFTGWLIADPIVSIIISVIIVFSAVSLVRESVNILMEGVPSGIEVSELQHSLSGIPGVIGVHDIHIWTLSSGLHNLSCHLTVSDFSLMGPVLKTAHQIVDEQFKIHHSTFQIEPVGFNECNNCSEHDAPQLKL